MGGATVMTFTGRFRPESFRAFAEDRARLLALDSAWRESAPDRMVVAVAGQRDFIDAFEMACSLGPMDCLVHEIERRDTDSAGIATFEREHDDG
ncbi:hypothetical protein [Methylorubrum thiocyanatum]|uniref:hypothetical protein n=1 Tax=Methylorubrum thiocyanatum TaxID=47958 RepID=UPI0035C7A015